MSKRPSIAEYPCPNIIIMPTVSFSGENILEPPTKKPKLTDDMLQLPIPIATEERISTPLHLPPKSTLVTTIEGTPQTPEKKAVDELKSTLKHTRGDSNYPQRCNYLTSIGLNCKIPIKINLSSSRKSDKTPEENSAENKGNTPAKPNPDIKNTSAALSDHSRTYQMRVPDTSLESDNDKQYLTKANILTIPPPSFHSYDHQISNTSAQSNPSTFYGGYPNEKSLYSATTSFDSTNVIYRSDNNKSYYDKVEEFLAKISQQSSHTNDYNQTKSPKKEKMRKSPLSLKSQEIENINYAEIHHQIKIKTDKLTHCPDSEVNKYNKFNILDRDHLGDSHCEGCKYKHHTKFTESYTERTGKEVKDRPGPSKHDYNSRDRNEKSSKHEIRGRSYASSYSENVRDTSPYRTRSQEPKTTHRETLCSSHGRSYRDRSPDRAPKKIDSKQFETRDRSNSANYSENSSHGRKDNKKAKTSQLKERGRKSSTGSENSKLHRKNRSKKHKRERSNSCSSSSSETSQNSSPHKTRRYQNKKIHLTKNRKIKSSTSSSSSESSRSAYRSTSKKQNKKRSNKPQDVKERIIYNKNSEEKRSEQEIESIKPKNSKDLKDTNIKESKRTLSFNVQNNKSKSPSKKNSFKNDSTTLEEIKSNQPAAIKSVVRVKDNSREKMHTSHHKEIFDLRSKLSRNNLGNHFRKISKDNKYTEKSTTTQENSVVTAANQNKEKLCKSGSDKIKDTANSVSKKYKKIKLVINVICENSQSSNSDEVGPTIKNTHKNKTLTNDLSFLDDLNIDDIVDSLTQNKNEGESSKNRTDDVSKTIANTDIDTYDLITDCENSDASTVHLEELCEMQEALNSDNQMEMHIETEDDRINKEHFNNINHQRLETADYKDVIHPENFITKQHIKLENPESINQSSVNFESKIKQEISQEEPFNILWSDSSKTNQVKSEHHKHIIPTTKKGDCKETQDHIVSVKKELENGDPDGDQKSTVNQELDGDPKTELQKEQIFTDCKKTQDSIIPVNKVKKEVEDEEPKTTVKKELEDGDPKTELQKEQICTDCKKTQDNIIPVNKVKKEVKDGDPKSELQKERILTDYNNVTEDFVPEYEIKKEVSSEMENELRSKDYPNNYLLHSKLDRKIKINDIIGIKKNENVKKHNKEFIKPVSDIKLTETQEINNTAITFNDTKFIKTETAKPTDYCDIKLGDIVKENITTEPINFLDVSVKLSTNIELVVQNVTISETIDLTNDLDNTGGDTNTVMGTEKSIDTTISSCNEIITEPYCEASTKNKPQTIQEVLIPDCNNSNQANSNTVPENIFSEETDKKGTNSSGRQMHTDLDRKLSAKTVIADSNVGLPNSKTSEVTNVKSQEIKSKQILTKNASDNSNSVVKEDIERPEVVRNQDLATHKPKSTFKDPAKKMIVPVSKTVKSRSHSPIRVKTTEPISETESKKQESYLNETFKQFLEKNMTDDVSVKLSTNIELVVQNATISETIDLTDDLDNTGGDTNTVNGTEKSIDTTISSCNEIITEPYCEASTKSEQTINNKPQTIQEVLIPDCNKSNQAVPENIFLEEMDKKGTNSSVRQMHTDLDRILSAKTVIADPNVGLPDSKIPEVVVVTNVKSQEIKPKQILTKNSSDNSNSVVKENIERPEVVRNQDLATHKPKSLFKDPAKKMIVPVSKTVKPRSHSPIRVKTDPNVGLPDSKIPEVVVVTNVKSQEIKPKQILTKNSSDNSNSVVKENIERPEVVRNQDLATHKPKSPFKDPAKNMIVSVSKTVKPRSHSPIRVKTTDPISETESKKQKSYLNETFKQFLEKNMTEYLHESYKVCDLIHIGNFSKIIQCKDLKGQNYAIKMLRNKNNIFCKNQKELLKALQKDIPLENLNFVRFIDGFAVGSCTCFLMEYYPKNLEQVLEESQKCLHIRSVQNLSRQLVAAVTVLRHSTVIHSDIKPSHVLLNSAHDRLKLCGFEAAYYINAAKLRPDIGTVNYRAPEVILGYSAGYSIDVWSTALVMYEMAAKRKLFPGCFNNDILFKQMCTLSFVPRDMINQSQFATYHFHGHLFMRRTHRGKSASFVYKSEQDIYHNNILKGGIHMAYIKDWVKGISVKQKAEEQALLESFSNLLKEMLAVHPKDRLPIEFVYANPFLLNVYQSIMF